jgi:hypothetical protein
MEELGLRGAEDKENNGQVVMVRPAVAATTELECRVVGSGDGEHRSFRGRRG